MRINYTIAAFESLTEVVNFVESKNTLGAGIRWLDRFESFLTDALSHPHLIKHCHNRTFFELNLRCIHFNDWVLAFAVEGDDISIEAILHSSRLTD